MFFQRRRRFRAASKATSNDDDDNDPSESESGETTPTSSLPTSPAAAKKKSCLPPHNSLQTNKYMLQLCVRGDWELLRATCCDLIQEECGSAGGGDAGHQDPTRMRANLEGIIQYQLLETDPWGNGPLHVACHDNPPPESIRALLRLAVLIDRRTDLLLACNNRGQTPLHIACANHASADLLKVLLEHGGEQAMFIADRDCTTIFQVLVEEYELSLHVPDAQHHNCSVEEFSATTVPPRSERRQIDAFHESCNTADESVSTAAYQEDEENNDDDDDDTASHATANTTTTAGQPFIRFWNCIDVLLDAAWQTMVQYDRITQRHDHYSEWYLLSRLEPPTMIHAAAVCSCIIPPRLMDAIWRVYGESIVIGSNDSSTNKSEIDDHLDFPTTMTLLDVVAMTTPTYVDIGRRVLNKELKNRHSVLPMIQIMKSNHVHFLSKVFQEEQPHPTQQEQESSSGTVPPVDTTESATTTTTTSNHSIRDITPPPSSSPPTRNDDDKDWFQFVQFCEAIESGHTWNETLSKLFAMYPSTLLLQEESTQGFYPFQLASVAAAAAAHATQAHSSSSSRDALREEMDRSSIDTVYCLLRACPPACQLR